MYKSLAESLIKDSHFQHITSDQVENKHRRLERHFKRHVDDQNGTSASGKTLPLEVEMYEVFGGKEYIRPSALLGYSGGLKRKVKIKHKEATSLRSFMSFIV